MLKLLTAVLEAYVETLKFKRRLFIYDLEDEIDRLAADGSPAAKLRIERLSERLRFEVVRSLRSSDSNAETK